MSDMTDSASPKVAEAFPLVKPCTKCGVEKLLVDFSLLKRGKLGRQRWCKTCARAYRQRPGNKERQRAYQQAYFQRPEVNERQRAYMQAYQRSYQPTYQRRRRLKDPLFKLTQTLRARLYSALQGRSKSARTLDLIGCDIDFLRRWLEAKFLPGMTWENYGEWHVDHIMPCASFDLSDPVQQRTCFRWTNLQPLWAADNIRKSDNYAP